MRGDREKDRWVDKRLDRIREECVRERRRREREWEELKGESSRGETEREKKTARRGAEIGRNEEVAETEREREKRGF